MRPALARQSWSIVSALYRTISIDLDGTMAGLSVLANDNIVDTFVAVVFITQRPLRVHRDVPIVCAY